jgi:endonuclease/exonuclease/phosphatase family metal-dependent hydrolase
MSLFGFGRTYNVHHFEGMDGVVSVDAIAAIINDERPDLVGLQEVDRLAARSDEVDFPRELERLTGMSALFGPNLQLVGGADAGYGNAILSRFHVERWANHALPRLDRSTEQRGLLCADVTLPSGGSLTFATTHLEHTSAAERTQQVATIRGIVSSSVGSETPLVLCGDFNAQPDSAEMQLLESWGLADAWKQGGDNTAGSTIPSIPEPRARIDYIFVDATAGLRAANTRVTATQNPGASDHLPVSTDLVIAMPQCSL